jgi:hypothetical protein
MLCLQLFTVRIRELARKVTLVPTLSPGLGNLGTYGSR